MRRPSFQRKINAIERYTLLAISICLFFPLSCFALTPIARTDVVPYQRIEYGKTFSFGVVAFSKAGIDRVEFAISGQGYSGGIKTASSMTLNTRLAHPTTDGPPGHTGWPGVYEYYVEISSSEFTSDGAVTVTPTVFGKDGGSRALDAVTMIVEATAPGSHIEAWVDSSNGNDATGEIGNSNKPFETISTAVTRAQAANGGVSDGNIIYLKEGTYTLGNASANTSGEWLTIKCAIGTSRNNVTINSGGEIDTNTDLLKIEGVTISSSGVQYGQIIETADSTVWIDNCVLTCSQGRWVSAGSTNPNTYPVAGATFITDTYNYDVDKASTAGAQIVRNVTIYKIAEDAARNGALLVNLRIDDMDNGTRKSFDGPSDAAWVASGRAPYHSDTYQDFSRGPDDLIFYNVYATNLHYQGLFLRQNSTGENNAFVNVFMEMREPGTRGTTSDLITLSAGSIYAEAADVSTWNHLLVWHCSFPYSYFNLHGVESRTELTNVSMIGNVFWEFRDTGSSGGYEPDDIFGEDNPYKNVALFNHYKSSWTDGDHSAGVHSCSPDSGSATTQSVGGEGYPEVFDLTNNVTYANFGRPLNYSILVDRLPSNITGIPADALGALRDTKPDVGALEGKDLSPPPTNQLPPPTNQFSPPTDLNAIEIQG